jgi:hypothetical protein
MVLQVAQNYLKQDQLFYLVMHQPTTNLHQYPHGLCLHVHCILQVAQNYLKQDQLFHLVMHLPCVLASVSSLH